MATLNSASNAMAPADATQLQAQQQHMQQAH
eukprot:SAG11_NODE_24991_length_365_cov_0.586466_2_plen_30_part_01